MKIDIPNKWEAVTLREFQAVTKLFKEAEPKLETLKGNKKQRFQFELECAIISTLSGADMDDILNLHNGAHIALMNTIGFLSEPITGKVQTKVKVNGRKYYFEKDAKKITGGQWITIMHFLDNEDKIDENLHNLLACFAYDVKWFSKKYNGSDHNRIAEDMLDLPISFVKPLTDFFLLDWVASVKNMGVYLGIKGKQLKRRAEKELARSKASTDGSIPSTVSRTVGMTSDLIT